MKNLQELQQAIQDAHYESLNTLSPLEKLNFLNKLRDRYVKAYDQNSMQIEELNAIIVCLNNMRYDCYFEGSMLQECLESSTFTQLSTVRKTNFLNELMRRLNDIKETLDPIIYEGHKKRIDRGIFHYTFNPLAMQEYFESQEYRDSPLLMRIKRLNDLQKKLQCYLFTEITTQNNFLQIEKLLQEEHLNALTQSIDVDTLHEYFSDSEDYKLLAAAKKIPFLNRLAEKFKERRNDFLQQISGFIGLINEELQESEAQIANGHTLKLLQTPRSQLIKLFFDSSIELEDADQKDVQDIRDIHQEESQNRLESICDTGTMSNWDEVEALMNNSLPSMMNKGM